MLRLALILLSFSPLLSYADAPCSTEQFLAKICLSDQPQNLTGTEMNQIKCQSVNKDLNIALQMRQAFEKAPAWLQVRLCNLSGFGIYPTMPGSRTYSWSYPSEKYIGLSRIILEPGYTLTSHETTMIHQTLNQKTLVPGAILPPGMFFNHVGADEGLGVLYLMTHEMGHLIYNVSLNTGIPSYYSRCTIFGGEHVCNPFNQNEWGHFSWIDGSGPVDITYGTPLAQNADLVKFVASGNKSQVTSDQIETFTHSVMSSGFPTIFGVYSPEEDFCEMLAVTTVANNLSSWTLQFSDGSILDFRARLLNPQDPILQQKLQFLQNHILAQ